jgi:tetratricopeptide (TPR) repeat protein
MIVKNAVPGLRECLASVRGLVQQMVVADTGSTDGTPELARSLGAEVIEIPWQDHFAQARNLALQVVKTDWVLVLDDDEELDAGSFRHVAAWLQDQEVGGYLVPHRNYLPSRFDQGVYGALAKPNRSNLPRARNAPACLDMPVCRLFRRRPEICFAGRVHELVEPSIEASGWKLGHAANLLIHNFGALNGRGTDPAKHEYYRRLGRLKVQDSPEDAQAWMELGLQEYQHFKDYTAATSCFTRALGLRNCPPFVYTSLAKLYMETGSSDRALRLLEEPGANHRLIAGEREDLRGDALYNLGRPGEAQRCYRAALRLLHENPLIESKLGLTEVRLGEIGAGTARLTRALQSAPEVFEVHDRLIKAYVAAQMLPQAAEAAERLLSGFGHPKVFVRAASIRFRLGDYAAAAGHVERGLELFPDSPELLQARAELQQAQPAPSGD